MIGYKAFSKNMTNRKGYIFNIDKELIYHINKPIKLRGTGFHFCKNILSCLIWYQNIFNITIYKIEILGDVIDSKFTPKSVTNKFRFIEKVF